MNKSTLRRADLVFSVFLMVLSAWTMIQSIKLLINPFGRAWEKVSGDSIKSNIENWYQSIGLVPFVIAMFLLICALFLFHFALKEGARFDFFTKDKIKTFFKNRETQVAILIISILFAYVFVFMPVCRAYLDFFPRFQGFPFMIATFLMLASMMIILGEKKFTSILKAVLISAIAAAAIAYGFGMLALIPLP